MRSFIKGISKLLYFSSLLLIFPSFAYASNCLEPIGYGARAVGRGGVEIAIANDADALNSNPAGIIQIKRKQIDIGSGAFKPKVRFKNRYGRSHTRTQYYPTPEMGFVVHLKDRPIALGFGVFVNSGLGVHKIRILNPYFYKKRKMLGDSKLGVAKAVAALSYQVSKKLAIGFAFHYYYINYYLATPMGIVYLDADKLHGFGYGGAIGLLYKPDKRWSFGLSYTFKPILQDIHTDDAKVRFYNTEFMHCRAEIKNFGVPRKLAIGVAYHINEKWILGMDLEWQQYSRAFNELIVKASGAKPSPLILKLPFRFRDTYIFSVGTEYKLSRFFTLRFGYSLSTDVSPEGSHYSVSPLVGNFHNLAFGIGTSWKNYELNLAYVYCFEAKGENHISNFPEEFSAPEFNYSDTYYQDMYFDICITYHFR